jgi:diguanylate cyclase (GGDEF)-like protein/PAS domain S-box-containing protein
MEDGGRYVLRNKAADAVYGRPSALVLGKSDVEFLDREHAGRIARSDRESMRSGSSGIVDDETVTRPDGARRLIRTHKISFSDDDASPPRYVLGIAEDVTEQRASEARIAFMAHHDALTGLPNRYLFQDRLGSALARLPGTDQLLALLLIDLDGFKSINDTWGHAAGDEVLKSVAERINACLRPTDTGARLGGDEFAVVMAPIEQVGEAVWLATRLIGQLSSAFWVGGQRVEIGASIGISCASARHCDPENVTAAADTALYDAKRQGKNRFRFADAALDTRSNDTRSKGTA